jgi:hypothetical protein
MGKASKKGNSRPPRKRKGKIKISTSARLVNKKDKTRVNRPDTTGGGYPRMETQMPRSNGMVLKVKVKRK